MKLPAMLLATFTAASIGGAALADSPVTASVTAPVTASGTAAGPTTTPRLAPSPNKTSVQGRLAKSGQRRFRRAPIRQQVQPRTAPAVAPVVAPAQPPAPPPAPPPATPASAVDGPPDWMLDGCPGCGMG